jgi:beta-glucosidase
MNSIRILSLILISVLITNASYGQNELYRNASTPIDERVEDLLSRMTLYEKIGQMTQLNITLINTTGQQRDVVLVEEKARDLIRNHHIGSFLNGEAVTASEWFTFSDRLSRIAVEECRLGIPVIYGIDHIHGASYLAGATIFPHAINLGATFNPVHSYNTGRVTSTESADLGHHWNFAPVLDLGVNPLWPRLYETFGEDPHLASVMGAAYVDGYQNNERIAPYKVTATAKHFLAYSDPKSGWDRSPTQISMQAIHEFHRPPFQAAIDAGAKTVMVNSGEINGIPVHASYELLTELLRNEMGFEGVIVTDWDDIGKLVTFHKVAKDYKEATYRVVMAGVDMSMTPRSLYFNEAMLELAEEGRISEERIDESVRRILKLKFELGLFENPYPRDDRFNRIGSPEHKAKALEAARESIVLLRNENAALPAASPAHILVMGPAANNKRNLAGGWTIAWQGGEEERFPEDMLTIYTALKKEYPGAIIELVQHIPGNAGQEWSAFRNRLDRADLIVYAGGEEPYTEYVGNITDLTLPAVQLAEISRVSGSTTPVVLVLVQGRPRLITSIVEQVDAILFAGLPGFEGAEAIANLISGRVNPSGKMPISYPQHSGHHVPYNHKSSDVYFFNADEANMIVQGNPATSLFPFGYGLSYTRFSYSDLELSSVDLDENGSITATVTVTNTGDLPGMESVLWFISNHFGYISRPVTELKYFEKTDLAPGESQTVSFTIDSRQHLAYPDHKGKPLLEPGSFTLTVGGLAHDFNLSVTDHQSYPNTGRQN